MIEEGFTQEEWMAALKKRNEHINSLIQAGLLPPSEQKKEQKKEQEEERKGYFGNVFLKTN